MGTAHTGSLTQSHLPQPHRDLSRRHTGAAGTGAIAIPLRPQLRRAGAWPLTHLLLSLQDWPLPTVQFPRPLNWRLIWKTSAPLVAGDEHYSELEKKLGLKLKTGLFGTVRCLRDEGQSSPCSSQEKLNEGWMRTKINGEGLCGCFFPPENCRICFNKRMLLYARQHVRAERSLRHHLVQTHAL